MDLLNACIPLRVGTGLLGESFARYGRIWNALGAKKYGLHLRLRA